MPAVLAHLSRLARDTVLSGKKEPTGSKVESWRKQTRQMVL